MTKQSKTIVDECRDLLNNAILSSPDLFGGNLGLAVYYAWMTHKGNNESDQVKSITHLDKAIKAFQEQKIYNGSFAHGLAGLGFTLRFLDDMEIADYPDSFINQIDKIIYKWSFHSLGMGDFDYLHGAGGSLLYLLTRIGKSISITDFKELLNLYLKIGSSQKDSIIWKTPNHYNVNPNDEVYNQSLSHGASSVLVILNKIIEYGIEEKLCSEVLEMTFNGILENPTDVHQYGSFYASRIKNGVIEPSRLSWCYGDMGLLIATKQLSQNFQNLCSSVNATQMIKHHSFRRSIEECRTDNEFFCHGTSGLRYIFSYFRNDLFTENIKDQIDSAIDFWEQKTVNNFNKSLYNPEKDYGLLEGIAGLSLSMDDHKKINNRSWSEIFLIY